MKRNLLLLLLAVFSAGAIQAQCVNPWITSDAKVSAGEAMPNTYSIEAFHADPIFAKLQPREFCHKLFELYFDGRRKNWRDFQQGLTLWSHTPQEPRANREVIELDPILLLNVHGSGYCGIQSGLLEGIYQTRPGGKPGEPLINARRWFLAGIVHSVCDAYYDGKWHYFDLDLGGWAGDQQKEVWSVADVIANPKGYYGSQTTIKSKYFFKADQNGKWVEKIRKSGTYAFQDNLMVGHEMAMTLRPGETFTRYFSEKAAGWSETPPFTRKFQKSMKGYFELVYEPDARNINAGILYSEGKRMMIVPIRVPYNITSSKVECTGKASVSIDLGATWIPLPEDGSVAAAVNRWDYLLKVEGGRIKKVTTRGFLHPAALPRVGPGKTTMTVNKMADYQVLTYIPDWSTPAALARTSILKGLKYQPRKTMSLNGANLAGAGELIIPVKAPSGARIVKLGATVIGGGATRPDPKRRLELYLGPKGDSKLVERSTDCSTWGLKPETRVDHWQINVNGAARLEPCDEAEVKVTTPGWGRICSVRIYVGYIPAKPRQTHGKLTITHGFDGTTFSRTIDVATLDRQPVTYTVDRPARQNQFIRLSVR